MYYTDWECGLHMELLFFIAFITLYSILYQKGTNAYSSGRVPYQGKTVRAADIYNARTTILNIFTKSII